MPNSHLAIRRNKTFLSRRGRYELGIKYPHAFNTHTVIMRVHEVQIYVLCRLWGLEKTERAMREVQGCSGAGPRSRKLFPQIKIYHYAPGEVRFDRTPHLSWSSVCLPTTTTTFTNRLYRPAHGHKQTAPAPRRGRTLIVGQFGCMAGD